MIKCSNISCEGPADVHTVPTDDEKQFGRLCPVCRDAIANVKGIRKAVCMNCGKIVMLFTISKKDVPVVLYCEECRQCGDIKKECRLFSVN